MAEVASISQQAVSRITKGAGTGECTCRLSFGCQSDNLLQQAGTPDYFVFTLRQVRNDSCGSVRPAITTIWGWFISGDLPVNQWKRKIRRLKNDDCEEFSCGYGKNKDSNSVLYLKQKFWRVYQDAFMRGIKRK